MYCTSLPARCPTSPFASFGIIRGALPTLCWFSLSSCLTVSVWVLCRAVSAVFLSVLLTAGGVSCCALTVQTRQTPRGLYTPALLRGFWSVLQALIFFSLCAPFLSLVARSPFRLPAFVGVRGFACHFVRISFPLDVLFAGFGGSVLLCWTLPSPGAGVCFAGFSRIALLVPRWFYLRFFQVFWVPTDESLSVRAGASSPAGLYLYACASGRLSGSAGVGLQGRFNI